MQYDFAGIRLVLSLQLETMLPTRLEDPWVDWVPEVFVLASAFGLRRLLKQAVKAMRFGSSRDRPEGNPGLWDSLAKCSYPSRGIIMLDEVNRDWRGRARLEDILALADAIANVYSDARGSYSWSDAADDVSPFQHKKLSSSADVLDLGAVARLITIAVRQVYVADVCPFGVLTWS